MDIDLAFEQIKDYAEVFIPRPENHKQFCKYVDKVKRRFLREQEQNTKWRLYEIATH